MNTRTNWNLSIRKILVRKIRHGIEDRNWEIND